MWLKPIRLHNLVYLCFALLGLIFYFGKAEFSYSKNCLACIPGLTILYCAHLQIDMFLEKIFFFVVQDLLFSGQSGRKKS